MGPWASNRGVMSLRSISTKRAEMKVMNLGINISQERQSGKDNAEQGSAVDNVDDKQQKKTKVRRQRLGGMFIPQQSKLEEENPQRVDRCVPPQEDHRTRN